MGGFSNKVQVGKEQAGDAKAAAVSSGCAAGPLLRFSLERFACRRPAGPPGTLRRCGQVLTAPPCLPLRLQGRPGVLTRRAAAQLAAAGTGNGQVGAARVLLVGGCGERGTCAHMVCAAPFSGPPLLPSPFPNMQAGNPGSWGAAKPRNGLRPRDSNVPVVSQAAGAAAPPAEKPAPAGRSMSQLLHERSEAALSAGKTKEQCAPALPDIDSADAHDPLAATDFVTDIFSYYKRVEPQLRVAPDYMSRQVS